ncbi:MAG: thrombospondin type-1 domain-containing protein [Patescibacteria group bacterium]
MSQKTINQFSFWAIIVGSIFLANGLILAWNLPSTSVPDNNTLGPLSTNALGQYKSGGLNLNTGGAAIGLIVDKGRTGVGTQNPQAELEVSGAVKIANTDLAVEGLIKYMPDLNDFCGYNGSSWASLTGNSACVSYTYSYTGWSCGSCSVSCGGGTRTCTRSCQRSDGASVNCSYCGGYCSYSESCNTQSCATTYGPNPRYVGYYILGRVEDAQSFCTLNGQSYVSSTIEQNAYWGGEALCRMNRGGILLDSAGIWTVCAPAVGAPSGYYMPRVQYVTCTY